MNNRKLSINGKKIEQFAESAYIGRVFIENWEIDGEKLIHGNVDNNGKMCSVTMN